MRGQGTCSRWTRIGVHDHQNTHMLEGRKDKVRFDYDSILPLFNRNSLQIRARTTNDNQVFDLKFTGALAFVQNIEQFRSKAAKERVVSIHSSTAGLDSTYKAWKHIKTYTPEQLSGVGHYILTNRKHFEKSINTVIESTAIKLRENGVTIDRIAKNHAVVYAGVALLTELAKSSIDHNLFDFTLQSALSKIETSRSELLLADHFLECIDGFNEQQGVFKDEIVLIIHLPSAIKFTGESWNKTELLGELKLHDSFSEIKTTRVFTGKDQITKIPKTCWHFKIEKSSLQSYKAFQAV